MFVFAFLQRLLQKLYENNDIFRENIFEKILQNIRNVGFSKLVNNI
jgi:hypothetical protein